MIILNISTLSNDLNIFTSIIVSKNYLYATHVMSFQIILYMIMYFTIFILDIFTNTSVLP